MSFLESCEKYFGTQDFYEILNIKKEASASEVKKAYHKVSLVTHPDRVPEHQKLEATEKFKALSRVYSILSDADKRQQYDEVGTFDEEFTENLTEWLNIWRSMFKPITKSCIDTYKMEYLNSDSELRDIKKAYVATKGNMTKMHNMIPFLDVANEERIIAIVRKLVDNGEVEEYDGFFNEPKAKKNRRKRKEDSYKLTDEEAEKMHKEMQERQSNHQKAFAERMAELEAKYCTKKPKASIKSGKSSDSVKKGKVGKRTRK